MATRRSRLQIKPNIGPRGAVKLPTRPLASTAATAGNKPSQETDSADKDASSIDKQSDASPAKRMRSPPVAKDKQINKQVVSSPEKASNANQDERDILCKGAKDGQVIQTEICPKTTSSSPTDGEVAMQSHQVPFQAHETSAAQTVLDLPAEASGTATGESTTPEIPLSQKRVASNQAKTSPMKARVPLRNRLPKAKPNLADAGRRKNQIVPNLPAAEKETPKGSTPKKSKDAQTKPGLRSSDSSESVTSQPTALKSPTEPPESRNSLSHLSEGQSDSIVKATTSAAPATHGDERVSAGEKRTGNSSEGQTTRKRPRIVEAPVDKPPDRSKMKMKDLIYWNPRRNPIKPPPPQEEKEKPVEKDAENIRREVTPEVRIDEDTVDNQDLDADDDLAVPQVKIGPDGSIILNEQSLVVETEQDQIVDSAAEIIHESAESFVTYASFRNRRNAKLWKAKETEKFFKALSCVGTDFSLMLNIFPKRTRHELKNKFKREERTNKTRIDVAIREKQHFNLSFFDNEDTDEEVIKKPKKKTKKTKDLEEKKSKAVKKNSDKVDDFVAPNVNTEEVAPVERPKRPNRKKRKGNFSYYEDSDSEVEASRKLRRTNTVDAPSGGGTTVQPCDDGEVVDILVGMSQGRLSEAAAKIEQAKTNAATINTTRAEGKSTPKKRTSSEVNKNLNAKAGSSSDMVQLTDNNQLSIPGVMDDSEGRFILVTVVPEDGGETVIHVYRVQPGPGQSDSNFSFIAPTGQTSKETSEGVPVSNRPLLTSEPSPDVSTDVISKPSTSNSTETVSVVNSDYRPVEVSAHRTDTVLVSLESGAVSVTLADLPSTSVCSDAADGRTSDVPFIPSESGSTDEICVPSSISRSGLTCEPRTSRLIDDINESRTDTSPKVITESRTFSVDGTEIDTSFIGEINSEAKTNEINDVHRTWDNLQ